MEREEFRWVSKICDRIIDAVSLKPKLPLLCLSFAQKFPNACLLANLPREVNLRELAKGTHYGVICYLLKEINFVVSNPVEVFRSVLLSLKALGYTPRQPCDPVGLSSGRVNDHVNLCLVLARAVFEKSMRVDRIVDDLKRLPRTFFVLNETPSQLETALSLWLHKFHSIHELSDSEGMNTFAHVAGALSRVFPARIRRAEIKFGPCATKSDIELNKQRVFSLLDEIGAYMPESFPVSDELFHVAMADLFYATRQAVKRFVRVDVTPPIAGMRPVTAKPARVKRVVQNNARSKVVVRPATRKAVIRIPALPRRGEIDELSEIYMYMSRGDRRAKFIEVDDPKVLIENIVKLMNSDENEHTFANLQLSLHDADAMTTHMHNGIAFLTALAGSNNEFQASKKVVYFARRMMKTMLGLRPMTTAGNPRRTHLPC